MGGYWDFEADQDESGEWPSQSRPSGRDGAPPVAPPGAPPFDSGPEDLSSDFRRHGAKDTIPVQLIAGRAKRTIRNISLLKAGLFICLNNYLNEPLEVIYKGKKVADATAVLFKEYESFSVMIERTIGRTKIGYLHFVGKDKREEAQITRFGTTAKSVVRIHVQRKKKQILLKDSDEVEVTAELGQAQIPLSTLMNFRKDRLPVIQLDNVMKSFNPGLEPVRIKVFGQTVFLGRLLSEHHKILCRKPRKLIEITEVLI